VVPEPYFASPVINPDCREKSTGNFMFPVLFDIGVIAQAAAKVPETPSIVMV